MISVKKLKEAGIMNGAKTQLKKFETETAGEYAKRKQFKKGGSMIKEYGGKEKYKSKAAMKKHEKKESKKMESREKYAHGGPVNVKANDAVDMVGNPKGKKKPIQIKGWGKARH